MLTFVQLLEEIAQNDQKVVVPADEVNRLVAHFGDRVRSMGQWNTSDGSLEIPVTLIVEAARDLGSENLTKAVNELKYSGQLSKVLESSCASALIDRIAELNRDDFRNLMASLEQADDPAEIERLKANLDLTIFGR